MRFTSILILACLVLLPAAPASAWFFDNNTLVTIDGVNFTKDDFKHWWKYYQEGEMALPKTPDPYIEWLLLKREAERMDLAEDPGFKRQSRIFLQSRGLLKLKYEEVDSKINVTDADIRKRYEEKYLPRWQVQHLTFKDDEAAAAAWQELAAGTLTIDELLARDSDQGGPMATGKSWLRPVTIDSEWTDIFRTLAVGEVADPSQHKKGPELFYLVDQKGADDEDSAKWREEIRGTLWKEQENRLTQMLLFQLRDKYEVKIDEERLAVLDLNASDDTFTDAPIITSSRQNVSEKEFMVVIRRLMANRAPLAHVAADEEESRLLKAETAENIIAQSVTNWEALDRRYEEREPFKWEYEFNHGHRLVTALEKRLFAPEAKVTEEEVKQHYEENIDRYTQPTLVKLYIIDETQAPIDLIWSDAAVGKNFRKVLKDLEVTVNPQEAPANHLDPEVKAVIDKLVPGETSQIFTAQGIRVLAHLVEKTPEAPIPLERVQQTIHRNLWREKLERMLQEYLDTIKSRSEIEVRQRQWEAIQKELEEKDEA